MPLYKVYRPGTGLGKDVALAEFTDGGRFRKVAPEEAQANWTLCFTEAEKYCSHGKNCKHGARCTVGRRVARTHAPPALRSPLTAHRYTARHSALST